MAVGAAASRRVVHLSSVHPANDTRIYHKECTTLANAGYEVSIIAQRPATRMEDKEALRVRFQLVEPPSSRITRLFFTVPKVLWLALRERAEIYHFHDPELIPVGIVLRMFGHKVIYDVHEDYCAFIQDKDYLPGVIRGVVAGTVALLERLVGRFCVIVLAERAYRQRFPRGVTVLNYPLLNRLDPPDVNRDETEVERRVLYTGHVTENRGALVYARLASLVPDLDVHVVGKCDPSLAERMSEIAGDDRERLHLTGVGYHVPYSEILELYRSRRWLAGLALFTGGHHNRFKELTKFFEYMAVGMPILCTDYPVWCRLVEGEGVGLCVDPSSESEVREAVCALFERKSARASMRERGIRAAQRRYSWEREAGRLLDVYEELSDEVAISPT